MPDLSKLCDLIRDGRITTSASRPGKSRWIVRATGRWTRGSLNHGEQEEEETATGHGGSKREEKTDEVSKRRRGTRRRGAEDAAEKREARWYPSREKLHRPKEGKRFELRSSRSIVPSARFPLSLSYIRVHAYARSRIRVRGRHHRDPDVSHGT